MNPLTRLLLRLWRDPATRWPLQMLLLILALLLLVWWLELDAPQGYRLPLSQAGSVGV